MSTENVSVETSIVHYDEQGKPCGFSCDEPECLAQKVKSFQDSIVRATYDVAGKEGGSLGRLQAFDKIDVETYRLVGSTYTCSAEYEKDPNGEGRLVGVNKGFRCQCGKSTKIMTTIVYGKE